MIKEMINFFKNRIFWCFLIGMSFTGILVYVLYFTSIFTLREIKVLNNKKVSKSEIIKLTGLKGGERLFRIPLLD